MTFSVPSVLLFPSQIDQRRVVPNKYQQVLAAGLKQFREPRSVSCTKLPPLNVGDKGSPALSSASTRASSTTSARSHSKSSSCTLSPDAPDCRKDLTCLLPTVQKSRRSSPLVQMSASDLRNIVLSELPTLLTGSRHRGPQREALSHKTISFIAQDQSKHIPIQPALPDQRRSQSSQPTKPAQPAKLKRQRTHGRSSRKPSVEQHQRSCKPSNRRSTITADHQKEGANVSDKGSTAFLTGLIDTGSLSSENLSPAPVNYDEFIDLVNYSGRYCEDSGKSLCAPVDSGKSLPVPVYSGKSSPVPVETGKSSPVPVYSGKSSPVPVDTGKSSPGPAIYFGDTVYLDGESAHSSALNEVPMSDLPHSQVANSEQSMESTDCRVIGLDANALAADEATTPTKSGAVGIGENEAGYTIQAVLSPRSVSKKVGMRHSMRARKLFHGQTVGMRGQIDAMNIPEDQLASLTNTFTRYDEDRNGRLSVLEFGKFLQDIGMSLEISDVKEAVAMVAPQGRKSIDLASFTQLVGHGLQAEALREERYCGYSKEEAEVLQGVFNAYDVNHSGVIEAAELGNLLHDVGQAPTSHSEQEQLRAVLEKIVGGSLRPLRFREFLELAKILDTTTLGSGGWERPQEEHRLEHRRSSDRIEVARKAGLMMADVMRLQEIFKSTARNGSTLSCVDLYDLLKSRLKLHAAEGEREQKVHLIIEKCASQSEAIDFDDFLIIVGNLVDASLATVPSLLGGVKEERSTHHFLGHMAALLG